MKIKSFAQTVKDPQDALDGLVRSDQSERGDLYRAGLVLFCLDGRCGRALRNVMPDAGDGHAGRHRGQTVTCPFGVHDDPFGGASHPRIQGKLERRAFMKRRRTSPEVLFGTNSFTPSMPGFYFVEIDAHAILGTGHPEEEILYGKIVKHDNARLLLDRCVYS